MHKQYISSQKNYVLTNLSWLFISSCISFHVLDCLLACLETLTPIQGLDSGCPSPILRRVNTTTNNTKFCKKPKLHWIVHTCWQTEWSKPKMFVTSNKCLIRDKNFSYHKRWSNLVWLSIWSCKLSKCIRLLACLLEDSTS